MTGIVRRQPMTVDPVEAMLDQAILRGWKTRSSFRRAFMRILRDGGHPLCFDAFSAATAYAIEDDPQPLLDLIDTLIRRRVTARKHRRREHPAAPRGMGSPVDFEKGHVGRRSCETPSETP